MAWTYQGNPSASPVDMVHFRLGDTSPDNMISTDEECAQALEDSAGNTFLAAALLAESKAMTLLYRSQQARGAGAQRVTIYADQAEAFRTLAATLRMQASLRTTTPYVGGVSVGEKRAARADRGDVQPFARKDLHTGPPHTAQGTETTIEREE